MTLEHGSMKYQIIQPHVTLKKYVQYFWTINIEDNLSDKYSINTFVDYSSGIIFQHNNGTGAILSNGVPQPVSMIYGPITKPSFSRAISGFNAVGVLFHPYAISALFRTEGFHFTDNILNINDFEKSSLTEQIIHINDPMQQVNIISNYLVKKMAMVNKEDSVVTHCLSYIKNSSGIISVKELCRYYNISERQLERKFSANVGVSPSHYIKVVRFNKAMDLIKKGEMTKLSDIAFDLNYYDQSHFIRDVKKFTGYNPKKIKSLDTPAVNLLFEKLE